MSDANTGNAKRIRFGSYEADLGAGELRKSGRRIPLQEQPFQVLVALLELPGDVVTREQLRERLWPGQPFVDFDQGLNTAIAKLRDALGDSAANPRFVETVPRRGYRFTFPLEPEPEAAVAPESPPPSAVSKVPTWYGRHRVKWLGAGCLVLVGLGLLVWPRRPGPASEVRRYALRIPVTTTGTNVLGNSVVISPDGKQIAYTNDEGSVRRLLVQNLDQERPVVVEGVEGADNPFWSPDSKTIGFLAMSRRVLMRVPKGGGVPTQVCDVATGPITGASWSPDGRTIIFSSLGDPGVLREVSATGGTPQVVVGPDFLKQLPGNIRGSSRDPHSPAFLPTAGRRIILFSIGWSADPRLVLGDLDSGRAQVLGSFGGFAYSPPSHVVVRPTAMPQDLWALPFSLARFEATGPAFPIVRNGSDPSVSMDGTLVYVDPPSERLVWLSRSGERTGEVGPSQLVVAYPAISPDGKSVAVESREVTGYNLDVWVHDLARGSRTRISTDPATDILPVWSPDGAQVAYSSYRSGNTDIFVRRADASSEEKTLVATPGSERVADWSRDGRHILYTREDKGGSTGADLWYLKQNDKGAWEPHPFLQTRFNERVPKLSPDGGYVAYLSNESGREELYVRPFPQGDRQWVISRKGAAQPRWARNGRELFYVEAGTLMAVPVRITGDVLVGAPVVLFAHGGFGTASDPNYDVSADGQRFVIPERVGGQGNERLIHVVQNWFAEFRDRR